MHLSYIIILRHRLYNGQRDSLSILTWITRFLPNKINDLSPSDYQKVLNSKHIWIVDFYLPQCWHCQKMEPEFAIAAQVNAIIFIIINNQFDFLQFIINTVARK